MNRRNIILSILTLIIALPLAAQSDSTRTSGLKRYWNSLVHGNVDRTFERRMDLSFIIAPSPSSGGWT